MIDLLKMDYGMRKVGTWNQVPVNSREEIINIINKDLGFKHIGISACAYKDGKQILLFLPFDFDAKSLEQPWMEAKRLFNHLVDMDMTCLLQNSGRKGFHVIVEVEPKIYPKQQIAEAHRFFRDIDGLETFDPKLIGDVSRLIRISWTFHPNGTWCRVIAYHDGNSLDLDELPLEYETYERHVEDEYGRKEYYRPCVEFLVKDKDYWTKEKGRFEPSEEIRLSWAGIRLWRGDTIDEIIEEARNYMPQWDDFDADKIRRKLEYLDSREWSPHACSTLRDMGYCLPHIKCRYKRNDDEDLEALGIVNGRAT